MEKDEIVAQLATLLAQSRWITQEIHEIKTDVKNLNAFKFKVLGVAALAVALIEIARAGILK